MISSLSIYKSNNPNIIYEINLLNDFVIFGIIYKNNFIPINSKLLISEEGKLYYNNNNNTLLVSIFIKKNKHISGKVRWLNHLYFKDQYNNYYHFNSYIYNKYNLHSN